MTQGTTDQQVDLEAGFSSRLGERDRMLAVAAEGHLGAWVNLLLLANPDAEAIEIKTELWRDESATEPMGYDLSVNFRPRASAEADPNGLTLADLVAAAALINKAATFALREGMRPKYTALFDMLPNDGDSMA